MKEDRVAILGGGPAAHAAAVDLTIRGFKVNLCDLPQFAHYIKDTMESGEVEVTGAINGVARINMVTTDIKEAIKGVKVIFVMSQSRADAAFAEACAPYVEGGQAIVLCAGNCGSLVFANIFKARCVNKDVLLAETGAPPYGCRFKEPTRPGGPPHVRVTVLIPGFAVGVFPARRTEEVVNMVDKFYPGVGSKTNVFEAAMSNLNPMIHCFPVLLNVGCIENSQSFIVYAQGFSRSVVKVIAAHNKEKAMVVHAMGLESPPVPDDVDGLTGMFRKMLHDPSEFTPMGPLSEDRFITEDVPYGLVIYSSFGKMVGVDTPTIDAAIHLASIVNGVDYRVEGRTVEALGLAGMSVAQLNKFLYDGEL